MAFVGNRSVLPHGTKPWQANLNALRVAARAQSGVNSPHQAAVMSSPPAITIGTSTPSGLTSAFVWTTSPFPFAYDGGVPTLVSGVFQFFGSATLGASGGNVSGGLNQNFWRVRSLVNTAKVAFHVRQTTAKYRFIVDGQYVDFTGTTANLAGGDDFVLLDFTAAGGKKLRDITIEGALNSGFIGISVAPGDTVVAPAVGTGVSGSNLRISFFGDSLISGAGPAMVGDGFAIQVAEQLGLTRIVASGVGGSGYLATTGGVYNFTQRMSDITTLAPFDIGVIAFGINDSASQTAITAAALSCLQQMRSTFPRAPLFVIGPWNVNAPSDPSTAIASVRDGVKAAAAQVKGAWFIDPTALAYTKADSTHPDSAGSGTIANFVAGAIKVVLSGA